MSDAYERLNDEAEKRTWELSAREYEGLYERYKPGRDCDPAPIEEVTFEEQMEWEEIKKRQEELHAKTVTMDHANVDFLYHTIRDTLKDGGMPEGRAMHFAWKIVKAFTEKA